MLLMLLVAVLMVVVEHGVIDVDGRSGRGSCGVCGSCGAYGY